MIVIDEKFVDEMKSLTVGEAIEIFSKGVFVKHNDDDRPLYGFTSKALRLIGDKGAVWVLASNEIPKERKEVIEYNIASWYCWNRYPKVFPKAAAYVARNGHDEAKMIFIGACNTEIWLDVSLNASEEVMMALLNQLEKRVTGLRGNYNYEGEVKEEIDDLKMLARSISLRDGLSDEIREMAKYAAL